MFYVKQVKFMVLAYYMGMLKPQVCIVVTGVSRFFLHAFRGVGFFSLHPYNKFLTALPLPPPPLVDKRPLPN